MVVARVGVAIVFVLAASGCYDPVYEEDAVTDACVKFIPDGGDFQVKAEVSVHHLVSDRVDELSCSLTSLGSEVRLETVLSMQKHRRPKDAPDSTSASCVLDESLAGSSYAVAFGEEEQDVELVDERVDLCFDAS